MSDPIASAPDISIVIPAMNEERRIARTLARLAEIPRDVGVTEIVVVDDGSTDATPAIVREAVRQSPVPVRLEVHPMNRGKSAALRTGMLAATGDVVALFDADLSVDPDELPGAIAMIESGVDVVTGRRRERDSQPLVRQLGSRAFASLQRAIVGLPFVDTQCPFKVMRRAVALDIAPRMFVERWNFDVEFLVLAQRRGYDVRELLVDWEHVQHTTIRLTPGYFLEQPRVLWQIRRTHGGGRSA